MDEILEKLCAANGVSGAEDGACEAARALLAQYAPDAAADRFGCVTGFIGDRDNGKPTVMLEAHIDEIISTTGFGTAEGNGASCLEYMQKLFHRNDK